MSRRVSAARRAFHAFISEVSDPSPLPQFLDGEEILGAEIIIAAGPDGMLCTLNGKVVKILEMVHNPSGEIEEIYLAEVQE